MVNTIIGKKLQQTQRFLEDGTRIPVTAVLVSANPVVSVKTDKNGSTALQLCFGAKKHTNKAILGHVKGANLKSAPLFFKEVKVENSDSSPKVGDVIKAADVLKPGDIVDISGVSKGKGFAGVVKRHHFKGGPRTHGQSDRERAPGSIGQTTTPGRVYRGKRMAGRMGKDNVTVKNLKVVEVEEELVLVKGLIPGSLNNIVVIKKTGEDKKFVPLYKEKSVTVEDSVITTENIKQNSDKTVVVKEEKNG